MQPQKQPKRKFAASIGGLFILLALVGAIAVVYFSVQLTTGMLDNRRQKAELEKVLTPIVMFDPLPFKDPATIDNRLLLSYSMWTVLSDDKALSYSRSEENFTLLVPASDLEAAAYRLFGGRVTLKHETFSDNETNYFYDEEHNTYQVPTANYLYVYTPKISKIEKEDGRYRVLVNYIPPDNAWTNIYVGGVSVDRNKSMVFIMDKIDKKWYVVSAEYADGTQIQDSAGENIVETDNDKIELSLGFSE